ncbi:unnamed protein product [Nezara viridula]|uniref:Phospholipid/glycerol acyltransferase domain-containing protein n=1 Tax=Nezara viridula TaxID=85310 RepID=A0A9P0MQU5_NEZVI|nr:unnamed protein product [Nezara viridula]
MFIKIIARIIFVIVNNVYCIPTSCIWILFLQPVKFYKPDWYWKIEGTFFHWLLAMVSMWSWSAGYDVVEIGDDIRLCLDDRTLVVANHQSTADVPMLMANFNAKKGVLPNIMWIMDRIFKFTNFGIVSIIHEDFFILSGKSAREEAVTLLKKHLRESYIPLKRKLMVLFPEGGFLRKRKEASKRYAIKNNLPILTNVSLPRLGAMLGIMDVMVPRPNSEAERSMFYISTIPEDDELRWVLDVTIAYPEGKPLDLPTIITGSRPPCRTFMFYRLFPSTELPRDQEEVTKWLFDRWVEKDRVLDIFYKTGEIPVSDYCSSPLPQQVVRQDPLRFFVIHLFFIASSYFHFRLITYAVSFVW